MRWPSRDASSADSGNAGERPSGWPSWRHVPHAHPTHRSTPAASSRDPATDPAEDSPPGAMPPTHATAAGKSTSGASTTVGRTAAPSPGAAAAISCPRHNGTAPPPPPPGLCCAVAAKWPAAWREKSEENPTVGPAPLPSSPANNASTCSPRSSGSATALTPAVASAVTPAVAAAPRRCAVAFVAIKNASAPAVTRTPVGAAILLAA